MEAQQAIRNPVDLGYDEGNIQIWRNQVMADRRYRCEDCGGFGTEMHECIVTRNDVKGMPPERALRVFSDCNMACLCKSCHEQRHGTQGHRATAWEKACQQYGRLEMIDWYVGFEWRTPEARFKRCCDE